MLSSRVSIVLQLSALLLLLVSQVQASEAGRPLFGRLEEFTRADGVCYVTLRTDDRRKVEETAAAPLCAKAKALGGKRVQLKWGTGYVDHPECAGRKDCMSRKSVPLIIAATPAGDMRAAGASR